TCSAGVCKNLVPVACPAPDGCHFAGTCDPSTGGCSYTAKPDGTVCNDTDPCTGPGTCAAGGCTGLTAISCGYNPPDPPLAYAFSSAPSCWSATQTGTPTCFTDPKHGVASVYAAGLLTDGARGGLLNDGTWVGFKGTDVQVTLKAAGTR